MLFTRCPECDTTFRVTDEVLKKANGQVRCGRCASVFNAYAELHDPSAKTFEPEDAKPRAAAEPPPAAPPLPTTPPGAAPPPTVTPRAEQPPPQSSVPTEPSASAASAGPTSMAAAVAEANLGPAEGKAPGSDEAEKQPGAEPRFGDVQGSHISANEVDRVLTSHGAERVPQTAYAWPPPAALPQSRSRWWSAAAALALVMLVTQAIHFFRSDIAGHPTFGSAIVQAYGAVGIELTPNWDVQQYQIIDWVATAEPNARGIGSLKITARIQNRGPQRQPYPAVQLRLKDRYEDAVASRMFMPAEYLPRDTPRERLMLPGETARAELEVVDPGPDAYGFELDVCIEVEASLVTCGTDEVFL